MIHAYDKVYLSKAQSALGRMLDFAVYSLQYDISEFFDLFLSSGVATRFEKGDYSVITGLSGVELAYTVLTLSEYTQTALSLGIPSTAVRNFGQAGRWPTTNGRPHFILRILSATSRSRSLWVCIPPITKWISGSSATR